MTVPVCGAKTKQGGQCGRPAGWGTDHLGVGRCKMHFGATPSHQMSGVLILARRDAATMGQPLDLDPHEAILECIRIAAGEVRYCSEKIAELDDDQAVGPVTTIVDRPLKFEKGEESRTERSTDKTVGPPALHIWIQARHHAMDRLVTYSKTALAAGVEERRVKIAEQTGELLAQVIQGVLQELGVANNPEAPRVVRRHLQLVAGQTP